MSFVVGFLVFPKITQLDMTGPFEVMARIPDAEVHLVWKDRAPIRSDSGLELTPTVTFAECPPLDLVCVPGGPGVGALLEDHEVLEFLRTQSERVQYLTSVCTGSMVLGAAGLLEGKRATCHWLSKEFLSAFGAIPTDERVVRDGNIITGGGVTAGIDFGLTIAADVAGSDVAKSIQLMIEYAPAPPFEGGTPQLTDPLVVDSVREAARERQQERAELVARAAQAMRDRQ